MFDRKQLSHKMQELFEVKITKDDLEEVFDFIENDTYQCENKKYVFSIIHDAAIFNEYAEDVMKASELHKAKTESLEIIRGIEKQYKNNFKIHLLETIRSHALCINYLTGNYFKALGKMWFLLLALKEYNKNYG